MLRLDDAHMGEDPSPDVSQSSTAAGVSAAVTQPKQHIPPSPPTPISPNITLLNQNAQTGSAVMPTSAAAARDRPSAHLFGAASAPPSTIATGPGNPRTPPRASVWASSNQHQHQQQHQVILDPIDHSRAGTQLGTSLYGSSPQMQPPSPLYLMSLGQEEHFLHAGRERRGRPRTRSSVPRFHGWTAPETLKEADGNEDGSDGGVRYNTGRSTSTERNGMGRRR